MRILVVSQYFWPENFRVNDLVQEFVKRGHEITVLTGIPNYPVGKVYPEFRKNPKAFTTYQSVEVIRVPLFPRGKGGIRLLLNYLSFVIFAAVFGTWKLRRQKFDVIFVFEPSPVTVGLPAVVLKKIKKVPIVFWVLDLWPETLSAVNAVKAPFLLGVVGKMVGFIYKNCDLILGQSKGFLKQIARYCPDETKIKYFPSWAESVFQEPGTSPAPEIPFEPDRFNLMFAGNIGEAQDFGAILDAAESLKDNEKIRWLIVGSGRKSEWLKDEVKKRKVDKSFLLAGRFPVDRMPSFYKHAQALLVSLKPDPFMSLTIPGKLQSYLMFGLPIIGMLDGEGASILKETGAGIVCRAGDGTGLAVAVTEMSELPDEKRCQMGTNGKQFAVNEFDRKKLIDRLEGWMKSIIKSN